MNGQNRRYVPQAVVRGATCAYACSCACAGVRVRVVCLGACTCMPGRCRPERYRGFLSLISDINVSRVVWLVIWLCHLKTNRVKRRTGGGLREWWSPTRTRRGEARSGRDLVLCRCRKRGSGTSTTHDPVPVRRGWNGQMSGDCWRREGGGVRRLGRRRRWARRWTRWSCLPGCLPSVQGKTWREKGPGFLYEISQDSGAGENGVVSVRAHSLLFV